jgi:hypothetical protein
VPEAADAAVVLRKRNDAADGDQADRKREQHRCDGRPRASESHYAP